MLDSLSDAGGRRVLDLRPRHVVTGVSSAASSRWATKSDRGHQADAETTCTGVGYSAAARRRHTGGDNTGILLRGTKPTTWSAAKCCASRAVSPAHGFRIRSVRAEKEEGGRHTPFFKGYRPQFYFRTTDVTGAVELPAGVEMVMPGDNIKMVVSLIHPIAMEEGLRFAIREGGRTVGAGVVAKIIK